MPESLNAIEFGCVNWRGEYAIRRVTPTRISWGATKYHPKMQWLLEGFDHDKNAPRDFALADCDFTASHDDKEPEISGHAPALDDKPAQVEMPEEALCSEILSELNRARSKFPGRNVSFAALIEEVGELATAVFEESADRVRKEAVQVAVMAMRIVLDGDHTFEPRRREKGLDALDPATRDFGEKREIR